MTALLLKFTPWIAAVLVVFGAGTWAGYHVNPYEMRYKDLVATQALDQADAEDAVRKTLTDQLVQAQETTRNNQAAMVQLANENAQIAADRDATVARVRRLEQLLIAASRTAAGGRPVPQSNRGSDPPDASGEAGLTEVERLLVDAKEEAERNADRLDTLVTQITPQVQP
jgi:hypothetical protein